VSLALAFSFLVATAIATALAVKALLSLASHLVRSATSYSFSCSSAKGSFSFLFT